MNYYSEEYICDSIGNWSTVPRLIRGDSNLLIYLNIDLYANLVDRGLMPGQCQAFLTSDQEFTWFVEEWEVVDVIDAQPGSPTTNLTNKKVYPAKVQGLSLPLYNFSAVDSNPNLPVTVRWREGLIRHSNYFSPNANYELHDDNIPSYRPGFGQTILGDLERLLNSKTVQCNSLGLSFQPYIGPLGRLMSMAFWVDPELAKQYDASKNKKKKKSLNEQDYQQMPEYPEYIPWDDGGGGGYGGYGY